MKKCWMIVFLLGIILAFTGCAVKGNAHSEFVTDTIELPLVPDYFMCVDLPKEMLLDAVSSDQRCKIYVHEQGDYELITNVFTAHSLDSALTFLTGQSADSLEFLSFDHYPIDEYRYAWSTSGEQGEQTCCGTLFYDGTHYYALSIHCLADKEKEHREQFAHILETAGLQANEGF